MSDLKESDKSLLKDVAKKSIEQGLKTQSLASFDFEEIATPALFKTQASFVTLLKEHQLRGCIGHLEAMLPLIQDVHENAFRAAFQDPRFPPVTREEYSNLKIEISILSEPQALRFKCEANILEQIRPQIDGLILEDRGQRGTFLPAVWETLPQKEIFWMNLKRKAGLPTDYFRPEMKVFRYTAEKIV